MKRILVCLVVSLLVFSACAIAETSDCGCGDSVPSASPASEKGCPKKPEAELPEFETEAMEWQCIYWNECVGWDTRVCEPCASGCFLGCAAACTLTTGVWQGIACSVGCAVICAEVCGECEYCDDWEQQHSCGWVFVP